MTERTNYLYECPGCGSGCDTVYTCPKCRNKRGECCMPAGDGIACIDCQERMLDEQYNPNELIGRW